MTSAYISLARKCHWSHILAKEAGNFFFNEEKLISWKPLGL